MTQSDDHELSDAELFVEQINLLCTRVANTHSWRPVSKKQLDDAVFNVAFDFFYDRELL